MGLVLKDVGHIAIEVRRESFIIHPGYGYKDGLTHAEGPFAEQWREAHPEFLLEDIDDLITALRAAKAFVKKREAR